MRRLKFIIPNFSRELFGKPTMNESMHNPKRKIMKKFANLCLHFSSDKCTIDSPQKFKNKNWPSHYYIFCRFNSKLKTKVDIEISKIPEKYQLPI